MNKKLEGIDTHRKTNGTVRLFVILLREAKKIIKIPLNRFVQKKKIYLQPRNIQPKISSSSEREPLQLEGGKTMHLNIHPNILKVKVLFFMMI